MMKVLCVILVMMMGCLALPVQAERLQFSGLSLSVGQSFVGKGNFGLGYTGFDISSIDRSIVSIKGEVKTIALKYRFALPRTPLYLGASLTFFGGSLQGTRSWSKEGVTATLTFNARALYALGVEAGYSPPRTPRLYLYAGVGVAVGTLTVGSSLEYKDDIHQSGQVTGLGVGPTLSIGAEFAFTPSRHVALDVTLFKFKGDIPCYRSRCGDGHAYADQTVVSLRYVWQFNK